MKAQGAGTGQVPAPFFHDLVTCLMSASTVTCYKKTRGARCCAARRKRGGGS
jgi:hypothetical protein